MSLADHWYVLCRSEALSDRPRSMSLLGSPLVLFRGPGGVPVALLDRCPHRNVPLSLGCVRDDAIECRYHGWRFDHAGQCVRVPGRAVAALPSARASRVFTAEQDGFVWGWGRADAAPQGAPFRLDAMPDDYTVIERDFAYRAGLHASLENTIDVPHTVFLHRGLFRTNRGSQRIDCTVTRSASEVRARYSGEARPETWLARLLAPGGGTLEHEDRFILPSIVRVEYRLGAQARLLSTALFTPLDEERTQLHVRIAYRLGRVPGAWLSPLLRAVAGRVLREDGEILEQQTQNLARFGGPRFASTELDLFSLQIQELLKQTEAGQTLEEPVERRVEIMM